MKNKKIFLIYIFLFCLSLQAMEKKREKPYHFCRRIKKIDINAPESEYKKLAQLLLENDLSACECAWNLVKEKKQKALTLLKDNKYLTQEGISKVEEFIEKIKPKKSDHVLIVHIHEDFPSELIKEVEDHFSAHFSVEFRKDKHTKSTGVTRDFVADYSDKNSESTLTAEPSSHLYLDDFFKQEKRLTRKGILLHEEQHIYAEHYLETYLVKNEIMDQLNIDKFPKDNKEFNKFNRAIETEADIILGACSDSFECARALAEKNFITIAPHNYDPTATHPTNHARMKLAWRIYKLKKAEKELKNRLPSSFWHKILPPLYC